MPTLATDYDRLRRSREITEHICEDCASCRGAAHHHADHYALGQLRIRIGAVLGLDSYTVQQLDFRSLQQRHAEAGFPPLGK